MRIKDFHIGQKVYEYDVERDFYHENTVAAVGKKYITVNGAWKIQYGICETSNDYLIEKKDWGTCGLLFTDIKSLDTYLRSKEMRKKIQRKFLGTVNHLTFEELKLICEIIDKYI